jgi:predicted DCC family thiol-disulfide oxidoreductase YuxK
MSTTDRTPPRELTVLYDAGCTLCRSARAWLQGQPTYLPLHFVPAGTPRAARLFPRLHPEQTLREITVVDDRGRVYRGAKAWVMCLWSTRAHRERALSLAKPALWPLAKRFVAWVSTHRAELGGVGRVVLGGAQ